MSRSARHRYAVWAAVVCVLWLASCSAPTDQGSIVTLEGRFVDNDGHSPDEEDPAVATAGRATITVEASYMLTDGTCVSAAMDLELLGVDLRLTLRPTLKANANTCTDDFVIVGYRALISGLPAGDLHFVLTHSYGGSGFEARTVLDTTLTVLPPR